MFTVLALKGASILDFLEPGQTINFKHWLSWRPEFLDSVQKIIFGCHVKMPCTNLKTIDQCCKFWLDCGITLIQYSGFRSSHFSSVWVYEKLEDIFLTIMLDRGKFFFLVQFASSYSSQEKIQRQWWWLY